MSLHLHIARWSSKLSSECTSLHRRNSTTTTRAIVDHFRPLPAIISRASSAAQTTVPRTRLAHQRSVTMYKPIWHAREQKRKHVREFLCDVSAMSWRSARLKEPFPWTFFENSPIAVICHLHQSKSFSSVILVPMIRARLLHNLWLC